MNDNTENRDDLLSEDFDLEAILSEFHEDSPEQKDASEIPEFAEEIPQLTEAQQAEQTPAAEATPVNDAALEGNTVRFDPISEEQLQALAFSGTPEETKESPAEEPAQQTQPSPAAEPASPEDGPKMKKVSGPAFDVEEEFIPAPELFTPRPRLRELKKKLVSGPEMRYYALSEIGTGRLQLAILVSLLVAALSAAVTVRFSMGLTSDNHLKLVIFSQILCLMLSGLMGIQLIMDSIAQLFKGRFTVNTLLTITFAVCMVDGFFCLKELRVPCCCAFSLEMAFALWARLQERNTEIAQLDTMRKAVRLHSITRVKKFYNGKDGLLRSEGEVEDFMDTYQQMPAPQLVQSIYAGLSLVACLAIAVLAFLRMGSGMALQIFATSLLVAVPASYFVSISRPAAILEQRLHMVGTVLCGWQGVKGLKGKAAFPMYDKDLFPMGSTKLNGVKFYGDEDPVDVVSYTASLITASGSGLVTVFKNLLETRGGSVLPVENFQRYAGGGIGGEVRGLPVLVGSLNFLQDMGVEIPEGTMVNQAVYAAIDGQLSAVYAITYAKMRSAAAGIVTLCGTRKVIPVVMCRDFMLTESFLRAKFNIKSRRLVFPDREQTAQLRAVRPDPEARTLALVTREELISAAYAVTGAKALSTACWLGVIIHTMGGVLGLLIMLVMAILGNTELLTPTNILLYQLVWGVPGLLVTEWTRIL